MAMPPPPGRTKLVIRHLPPNLPEDIFWNSVAPWVDDAPEGSVLYRVYVPGKVRKTREKANVASRAYLQFSTYAQVLGFHKSFDEHAFRDSKGQVYNAKVEFSPYQKTASAPRKVDQRQGTIEEEPDYQRFLELLKSPTDAVANTSNPSATVPQTTPLIEHLRAQRKAAVAAASKRHASAKSAASGGKTAPQIAKRAGKSAAQSSQKISVPPTASHEAVKKLSSAPGADRTATLASSDPQQPATQSPRKGKSGRQGKGQRPLAGDAAAAEGSKPARSPSAPPPKGKKGREGKKESQHREATKPIRDTAASTSTQAVEAPSVDQRRPDDSGGPSRQRRLPEGPPARPGTLGVEAANAGSGAQEAAPRPRRGDVQDSAGARRRLGNALAGIGAAAERRKARQPSTAAPVPNEGTGQASKS